MTRLDDFLGPLHQGVWEITIEKSSVTEPLDSGWEKSAINVPSPGTIASYRKGQYHVHETDTEWKVHLDRYDPKVHPILHLIDDAPLLLMISGTFVALLLGTREQDASDRESILKDQKNTWQLLVLLGIALCFIGFLIIADPLVTYKNIMEIVVPVIVILLGIAILGNGLRLRSAVSKDNLLLGASVLVSGIVLFYLPLDVWSMIILGILGVWAFASAVLSLRDLISRRPGVPGGFYERLALGVLSLVLAALIFLEPVWVVAILVIILGFIAFLLGIVLVLNGVRLRKRMSREWEHPETG